MLPGRQGNGTARRLDAWRWIPISAISRWNLSGFDAVKNPVLTSADVTE
jgi:hypothetical protein